LTKNPRSSFLVQFLSLILSAGAFAVESGSAGRLMLLGDSITEGKFADDGIGFRKELYLKLKANGLEMSFVGSYGESPYEGHFQRDERSAIFILAAWEMAEPESWTSPTTWIPSARRWSPFI